MTADVITTRPRWAIIRWSYIRAGHDPDVVDGDGTSANALDSLVDADMTEDPCGVPRVAALIRCRWCASWYVAMLVVCMTAWIPAIWLPIGAAFALSSASTLLAQLED